MIPAVLAVLAHCESLSVIVKGKRHSVAFTHSDLFLMCADGTGKTLYLIRPEEKGDTLINEFSAREQFGKKRIYQAAQLFKLWGGELKNEFRKLEIDSTKFRPLGTAGRIIYHSDKWGTPGYYYHDFNPETAVHVIGPHGTPREQIEGATIIKIHPVQITERGIE